MRVAIHKTIGQPNQVLTIEQVTSPTIQAGEVKLGMILSTIHNHDLMQISGTYGVQPTLPARAGTEAVARVLEIGEGVTHLEVGQRVTVAGNFGTWADEIVAPAHIVLPVPEAISDELAAQLLSMPMSAMLILDDLGVSQGQWMILNAAAGAVGKNLIMLAKARGIKVIGLVNHEDDAQTLSQLDIDVVENTSLDGWQARIQQRLNGESLQYGLDSVGGRLAGEMLNIMSDYAVLVSFGALSNQPLNLDFQDIIFKQATVRGFWGAPRMQALDDEHKIKMISEILSIAAQGQLKLPVAAIYDLQDVATAVSEIRNYRNGKVLLRGSTT